MSEKLTLERVPHTFDPRDFLLASIPEDQELSDLEGDQEYREICALADHLSKRIKRLEQRAVRRVSTPRHRRSVSAPAKIESGSLETSNIEYTCRETNNTEHRHWYLPYQYQSNTIPTENYTYWQSSDDARAFQLQPNAEYIYWQQPDNPFVFSAQPHLHLQAPDNFFTFSYKPTMESSESAEKLLGDLKCTACISRPTHKIVPCQHPVCYDHLLVGHDEESAVASLCARCHQVSCFPRHRVFTSSNYSLTRLRLSSKLLRFLNTPAHLQLLFLQLFHPTARASGRLLIHTHCLHCQSACQP